MKSLTCRFCGTLQILGRPGRDRLYRCKECFAVLTLDLSSDAEEGPGAAPAAPPPPPDPTADPVPQGLSFGKYTLDARLGAGAMGVVYDALDTTLNRRVALKILFTKKTEDPREAVDGWQRFIQEARLTANLSKHPNVVTVYEAAVHSGKRYIAMERIQGEPFGEWRAKHAPSRETLVRMLRDVASALHHAHEHGVIHRDVKPGNVLVDGRGVPIVTDFGLARSVSHGSNGILLAPGMIEGSPAYMSPEQVLGMDGVDARSDLYALGVMLYEALSGRQPFTGGTVEEVLARVIQDTVEPPTAGTDRPDPRLDEICLKAMAKEAHERHASAKELAEDLTRWLGDTAVRPARQRFRRIAGVVGTAALMLLGAAGTVLWRAWPERPDASPQVARGESLLAAGRADEALVAFQVALVSDPRSEAALAGQRRAERKRAESLEAERHSSQLMAFQREERIRAEAERDAQARIRAIQSVSITIAFSDFKPAGLRTHWLGQDRFVFASNGLAEADILVPSPGEYELVVSAGGEKVADAFPRFAVRVDGKPAGETALDDAERKDYRCPLTLESGERRLGIEFTNDFYEPDKKLDRNLHLYGAVLRRLR